MSVVYLIHFDRPYKHARHYLGSAKDLDARVEHHRRGTGAHLLRVVNQAGIGWRVVRTWPGGRELEHRFKGLVASLLCPICNPDGWENRGNVNPENALKRTNNHAVRDERGRFVRTV